MEVLTISLEVASSVEASGRCGPGAYRQAGGELYFNRLKV